MKKRLTIIETATYLSLAFWYLLYASYATFPFAFEEIFTPEAAFIAYNNLLDLIASTYFVFAIFFILYKIKKTPFAIIALSLLSIGPAFLLYLRALDSF